MARDRAFNQFPLGTVARFAVNKQMSRFKQPNKNANWVQIPQKKPLSIYSIPEGGSRDNAFLCGLVTTPRNSQVKTGKDDPTLGSMR
ncbi:hypothetical protein SLE2022_349560 [Rubroshorea leprosula]